MKGPIIYPAGKTDAIQYAAQRLQRMGYHLTASPHSGVTHLLLDVPSFDSAGNLRGGGQLCDILKNIPSTATVIGGNLGDRIPREYTCVDLLQDPQYLAHNANITAHCAIKHAIGNIPYILENCPVLVIGWGRIGKCLSRLLKQMGAKVTVAVRKAADIAMLQALGYETEESGKLGPGLTRYRVIFNTVPFPILTKQALIHCRPDCLKIDLASTTGIHADDVLAARGLPGKDAPESSGELIARSVLHLL